MIQCPECDAHNSHRKGSPVERAGIIFRRHVCNNCRHTFISMQQVITEEAAQLIEAALDEELYGKAEEHEG